MNNPEELKRQQMQIDPYKLPVQTKRAIMSRTVSQSKIGRFKDFTLSRPILNQYAPEFNEPIMTSYCDVNIVNHHAIDYACQFVSQGSVKQSVTPAPVILNIVSSNFDGTNYETTQDIRDEIINLRTNFNNMTVSINPFPLKSDQCIYMRHVTVIRPDVADPGAFYDVEQAYQVSMITVSTINKPRLLENNEMNPDDYIQTLSTIECIFQTAIMAGNKILILTPFGHFDDLIPVDDVVKLYNYCIHKYQHCFDKILICIPPYYNQEIYDYYCENIYKPQSVVISVDMKYDQLELRKAMNK